MPTTDEDKELSVMHKVYIGNEWLLTSFSQRGHMKNEIHIGMERDLEFVHVWNFT
jgi:hypothetical protein